MTGPRIERDSPHHARDTPVSALPRRQRHVRPRGVALTGQRVHPVAHQHAVARRAAARGNSTRVLQGKGRGPQPSTHATCDTHGEVTPRLQTRMGGGLFFVWLCQQLKRIVAGQVQGAVHRTSAPGPASPARVTPGRRPGPPAPCPQSCGDREQEDACANTHDDLQHGLGHGLALHDGLERGREGRSHLAPRGQDRSSLLPYGLPRLSARRERVSLPRGRVGRALSRAERRGWLGPPHPGAGRGVTRGPRPKRGAPAGHAAPGPPRGTRALLPVKDEPARPRGAGSPRPSPQSRPHSGARPWRRQPAPAPAPAAPNPPPA